MKVFTKSPALRQNVNKNHKKLFHTFQDVSNQKIQISVIDKQADHFGNWQLLIYRIWKG